MKSRILIMVAVTIFLTDPTRAQNGPTSSYVTTVGTAEVLVVPDIALISVNVKKSAKELVTAKAEADRTIASIVEVAKSFGVIATDVKTSYFSIKEQYESRKPRSEVSVDSLIGYRVAKSMVIRLRQVNRYDEFLTALVKIGVSDIGDVSLESSEIRKYKDEARAKAIRAAREKAAAFARELGQTIGKAIQIEERDTDRWNDPRSNYVSNSFSDEEDADETVAAFSVGSISIKAQVEVRFVLN